MSRSRIWLLAALLWFLPLNTPHLFDPDEGRYAEIPREMVASGDWVTPRLNAIKYFEKPALQYWATASAYELFGEHAWTARLWSALTAFVGLLVTFWLGRRLYGERAAAFAALVQGSVLLYVGMARITTLDMSLCFALQLAMSALALLAQRDYRSWRAPALLGLGVTLAVLSKGLVGILIPGAVAALYMLLARDWWLPVRARPWWALAILAVLGAPWFIVVSQRNPEFAHFFFIVQHFQRYLSKAGFDRYEPAWFFIPVLLVGFVPWTGLLPRSLREAVAAVRGGDRPTLLLLIWAAFVFAFFSLSQSKLIPYIVPMMPALALLCGRSLSTLPLDRLAGQLRAVAAIAAGVAAVVVALWVLPVGAKLVSQASTLSIAWFDAAFWLLAAGGLAGMVLARRGHALTAVAATALGSLLFVQSALSGADWLPRIRGVVLLDTQLAPSVRPTTRLYCVNDYVQPLPFYLRRPCTLVGYRGELDFGLQQEPWRGMANLTQFAADWQRQTDALAVLRPQDYQQLVTMGAPMRVIYTAPSFVAVVRP